MVCTFPPRLVGVLVVTIRPMLDGNQAFTPEDVVASRAAFDDCVKALRLLDRSDPAVALVAKGIIILARHGERNAELLAEQQSFRDESTGRYFAQFNVPPGMDARVPCNGCTAFPWGHMTHMCVTCPELPLCVHVRPLGLGRVETH